MRLFIETLLQMCKLEGMTQTDLVDRCNDSAGKDGLCISKGAISNYKQGRFPEPAYAALLVRNISKDVVRRNELAVAYLRDVANEIGIQQTEVDIVNRRVKQVDNMQNMPQRLRDNLTTLGRAALVNVQYRNTIEQLCTLFDTHVSRDDRPDTDRRGSRTASNASAKPKVKAKAKTKAKAKSKKVARKK